jgi:hypothetical protein
VRVPTSFTYPVVDGMPDDVSRALSIYVQKLDRLAEARRDVCLLALGRKIGGEAELRAAERAMRGAEMSANAAKDALDDARHRADAGAVR